ncbi:hypothetical protein HXX76_003383 [Chlamydomonas incerta]|uniref:Uncharacterized protein n=1 Tax=Chlamydomonas incerta TaxID=51695 RepID=A0A835TPP7_CHLIN|nr:hypothetical protein HXX76_003383 [Chlamydomonas incerta]|eukprot:KAG2441770.1 hypothetical protein HXX76_003383 [Chlamydomonas incerta]
MLNSGGGPPRLGAGPGPSLGIGGSSGGNYLQLLDNYGRLIAGQEGQLAALREQRAALGGEVQAARQQRDAAAELASTARARTAALEAERRTKESDLHAIKARNDALRCDVESRRAQLEQLKRQQGDSKEGFVDRCMQLEQEVRAVLAEHAAATPAPGTRSGTTPTTATGPGTSDSRNPLDQGPVTVPAALSGAGFGCGGGGGGAPSLVLEPGLTTMMVVEASEQGGSAHKHAGGGGEGLSQEGAGEGGFGSQLPYGQGHTQ